MRQRPAASVQRPPRQEEVVNLALWRTASKMVRQSGRAAPSRAREKAAAASFDGDADGARIWHAIAAISDVLAAGRRMI